MSGPVPLKYEDEYIREILRTVRTIAIVGASHKPERPSYQVMNFLQGQGYRCIPVNPGLEGQTLLGEVVQADLAAIPDPVDMVDIFRTSDAAGPVSDQAIAIGAKVVWMQLGVRNDPAAERAIQAGLHVVMERCPKIEIRRLSEDKE